MVPILTCAQCASRETAYQSYGRGTKPTTSLLLNQSCNMCLYKMSPTSYYWRAEMMRYRGLPTLEMSSSDRREICTIKRRESSVMARQPRKSFDFDRYTDVY